jgi:hypothetical protein
LAAILLFYGQHLITYYFGDDTAMSLAYHTALTTVVGLWAGAVVALYVGLARHWLPGWLPYASVAWDVLMIFLLLSLPGATPESPLVLLFVLVIASASLRLSLPVVYAATLACIGAYVLLLGRYVFLQVGYAKYYAPDSVVRTPRSTQVIVILAMAVAGLLAGQNVRQARRIGKARL